MGRNTALEDRVLILELSRLVHDFQSSIKKMRHHNSKDAKKDTSREYIDVDLLDDDGRPTVGSSTSQVCLNLRGCMRP